MDLLSAVRAKAKQAEVYSVSSESTEIHFEANEMKSATVQETQGTALRVIVDGRLGFAAASGTVPEGELIENALASARYGDQVPIVFPAAAPGPEVKTYDPELANVPIPRLVEIGREIIETLRAIDPDAKIGVDIDRSLDRFSLRNSAGADTGDQSSSFAVGISVERVRGDDVLMVYDSVYDIAFSENYREAVQRLANKVERAKRPARLRPGRMPVIFSPSGAMVLALPIMMGVNGQNVQRGTSPMKERLGEQLFDARLTLWDDPTISARPRSSSHDQEGVPCRRKALIHQGTCAEFLYDLRTAAMMETQSTGNGARGLFSTPSPSPSNLIFQEGDQPLREMLAGIEHGLLVESLLGLGQGNAISGAFSNAIGLGYLIDHGEITGRVKNVSIAGNIYENLREIGAISQENYWVRGMLRMPYILLPDMKVVGEE